MKKIKLVATLIAVPTAGGMFVNWLQPTEEEMLARFSPELRQKSLANMQNSNSNQIVEEIKNQAIKRE